MKDNEDIQSFTPTLEEINEMYMIACKLEGWVFEPIKEYYFTGNEAKPKNCFDLE